MVRTWWIWMAAAAFSCGCSGPAPSRPSAPPRGPEADYATPPEPRAAAGAANGDLTLSGVGRPDALIRLASPDGSAIGATASNSGAWSVNLPAAPEPRLYSLSEDAPGRPLRARGYVAVWSSPSAAAALLRPGAAAVQLEPRRGLSISSLDLDASGAAVVSGSARANEVVRLSLDGTDAGEDHADKRGRFVLSLPRALPAGRHVLSAAASGVRTAVSFEAVPVAIPRPPYLARRQDQAWRIDWMTPGGGIQTTLLFDRSGAAQ